MINNDEGEEMRRRRIRKRMKGRRKDRGGRCGREREKVKENIIFYHDDDPVQLSTST